MRQENYTKLHAHLESLDAPEIEALLKNATPLGKGIGGSTSTLTLLNTPIFIKSIPLTELEYKNPHSTKNLFNLPLYYQYCVGSAGFGAWRELECNRQATKWVLEGECAYFPLTYHFRIIKVREPIPPMTLEEEAKLNEFVTYWNGSKEIEYRLRSLHSAPYRLVLFCEYFPMNVHQWVKKTSLSELPNRMTQIEMEFLEGVNFMKNKGMIHFDAHFHNILTEGKHIYITDFGLSLCQDFELSKNAQEFFKTHQHYDIHYAHLEITRRIIARIWGRQNLEAVWDSVISGIEEMPTPSIKTPATNTHSSFKNSMNNEGWDASNAKNDAHKLHPDLVRMIKNSLSTSKTLTLFFDAMHEIGKKETPYPLD